MKGVGRMLKDKKGFTLVELIISMAVFAVVAGAITIFMITGTNSFNRTKHELDLQLQTQTVINQLDDMIRSANFVKYDSQSNPAGTINSLTIYRIKEESVVPTPAPGGGATPTPSPIAGVDPSITINKKVVNKKVVYWLSTGNKMYLKEFADDTTPVVYDANDENLLAEFITGFDAKVVQNAVKINLKMTNGKSKYSISETASMRNRKVTYP